MPEELETTRTLWILVYEQGNVDMLVPLYAHSAEDAEKQAMQRLEQISHVGAHWRLKAHPEGFTFFHKRLPGSI